MRAIPRTASETSEAVSGSDEGVRSAPRSSDSAIREACCSSSPRRSRHAFATASRTSRKLGRPWRDSGGKYVPA